MAEVVNQMNGVYWTGQDGKTYINVEGIDGGSQEWKAPLLSPTQMGLREISDPALSGGGYAGGSSASSGPKQSEINQSRDNTVSGGQTTLANKGSEYSGNQQKFVNDITDSQNTINTGKATNALNLRRSMSSIAGGVRQGLRSGGVMLANMGASDSGAAQAMADAYGKEGNSQASDANNQAMLQDEQLNTQQVKLNRDKEQGIGNFQTWKDTQTNTIKQGLLADLGTLNQQAASAGLAGVDLNQVNDLVNTALAQMAAIDARTAGQLGGVRGSTAEEANARAIEMDKAGQAGGNPFATGGVDLFQPAGGGQELQGAPITQIPLRFNRRTF
jgi:hypothetical protein